MLYLALDTATDRPTVALGTPEAPGADLAMPHRRDLSRDIDRAVRELLAARGASVRALSGIVVADGPGGFTGLRIGIAFAKGLCRVLGVPLLAAPSLLGAAWSAVREAGGSAHNPSTRLPVSPSIVVAEYDALRGDVYRAIYSFDAGRFEVVAAPSLTTAGSPMPSGAARAGAVHASAAALLALIGVAGGPAAVDSPAAWEPDYGRVAEAQARLAARRGPAW